MSDVFVCGWPGQSSSHDKSPSLHSRVKAPDPYQAAYFIINSIQMSWGAERGKLWTGRKIHEALAEQDRIYWNLGLYRIYPNLSHLLHFSVSIPSAFMIPDWKILTSLAYLYGSFSSLFPPCTFLNFNSLFWAFNFAPPPPSHISESLYSLPHLDPEAFWFGLSVKHNCYSDLQNVSLCKHLGLNIEGTCSQKLFPA